LIHNSEQKFAQFAFMLLLMILICGHHVGDPCFRSQTLIFGCKIIPYDS